MPLRRVWTRATLASDRHCYFFQNLAERLPTRTAAVVGGLIFAVLHLPGDEFSPASPEPNDGHHGGC
jgi:hypothetical protein